MITISQNQDIVYPFKLAADIDISFISDIKLSIKDNRVSRNSIFVRSIKAFSNTVVIDFGSDTIPNLGQVTIEDSGWGTINNLYIFGFVYIAVMPPILLEYTKNLHLLAICYNVDIDILKAKKSININNNPYLLGTLLLLTGQGAISITVENNNVFIERLPSPLYLFNSYQARSPYYITSINKFNVSTLNFIYYQNTPLTISLKDNTVFFKSARGFPVCKNQLR